MTPAETLSTTVAVDEADIKVDSATSPLQSHLWFSLQRQAFLMGGNIAFVLLGIYFAVAANQPGRLQGRAQLLELGDGWAGITFGVFIVGLFGWYFFVAAWRFSTDRPAILLAESGLYFHESIVWNCQMPWSELSEVVVEKDVIFRSWPVKNQTYYQLRFKRSLALACGSMTKPIKCDVSLFDGSLLRVCRFAIHATSMKRLLSDDAVVSGQARY